MKTVTANVLYPVYGITVTVADNASLEEVREALFVQADLALESSGIQPLIENCSVSELNDELYN